MESSHLLTPPLVCVYIRSLLIYICIFTAVYWGPGGTGEETGAFDIKVGLHGSHCHSTQLADRRLGSPGIYSGRKYAEVCHQLRRTAVHGGCRVAPLPGELVHSRDRVRGSPLSCYKETFGGFRDGRPPCDSWTQTAPSVHAWFVQRGSRRGRCDQGSASSGGEYRAQLLW